ncbi:MAG: hypothetical protein AAF862_10320 [Pseudomonadota bacterium]
MVVRRKTESSTLAFLDIISCGLGAVILIFLIIKHNVDIGSEQEDDMQAQLAAAVESNQKISEEVEALRRQNAAEAQAGKSLEDNLANAKGKLAALAQQNNSAVKNNKVLEGKRDAIEVAVPVDVVDVTGTGQANFIVGLKVEGERIGVLIDHSTSMTHATLDAAILAKFDTPAQRRNAPKWKRTVRVAKWLMARLPRQSQFAFVGFNDKAAFLSPGSSWSQVSDTAAIQQTVQNIAVLDPFKGTNLEAGIKLLASMRPAPTNIYIVTDGLPTQGSPNQSCAKGSKVTAACRGQLMQRATKSLMKIASVRGRPVVNTILLPMTGDSGALSHFWGISRSSNGLVLSPPEQWP